MRIWADCRAAELLFLEPLEVDIKSSIVGLLLLLVIRMLNCMVFPFLLMYV